MFLKSIINTFNIEIQLVKFNLFNNSKAMEALFKLLKTLTKSEKRYFKLHFNNNDTKYHYLFDKLESLKRLEKKQFAKGIMKSKEYSFNYLAVDINYLYNNLLLSLKSFHQNQTASSRIRNNLDNIEVLFNKGLFEDVYKLVKKTKILVIKYEYFSFIYELSRWEYKVMGNIGGIDAVLKAYTKNESIVKRNEEFNRLNFSYFQCNLYRKTWPKSQEVYKELLQKESLENLDLLSSSSAKIKLLQIHQLYSFLVNNKQEELDFLNQIIACIDQTYQEYKTEFTYDYVIIYSRYLYIHLELFPDWILQTLNSFLELPKKYAPHNERLSMFTKIFALNFCLSYYIKMDAFSESIKFLENVNFNLQLFENKVSPSFLLSTRYKLAYSYFMNDNFLEAIDPINEILNEASPNDNLELYEFVHLFNLILHIELQNFELVQNLLGPYQKVFNKSVYWKKASKLILRLVKDSIAINTNKDFSMLKEAWHYLQKSENIKQTIMIERYFDIRKYLENKIAEENSGSQNPKDIIDFSSAFLHAN